MISATVMRHRLMLGLVLTAAVGTVSTPSARQSAPLSIPDAVAHYAAGDFTTAVRDLDTRALKVAPFTRALDAWIAAGDPASALRRRRIAAAFALDAVWAVTREDHSPWQLNGDPSGRKPGVDPERELLATFYSLPLVAHWAVLRLPATDPLDAFEHALWLAAIGIAEDGHAWRRLQDDILPLARKRVTDDPRVRLADVLARTNLDVGSLRHFELTRNRAVLSDERLGSSVMGRIPQAIRAFELLLQDSALAGEVELRIGYLELRRRQWLSALTHLDAARSKATEPELRATADYFAGWVHEQLDQADDAITAYRRALAIAPTMRNLATRLSALLYLRNERSEAYAVLDRALNARPAPIDLLFALERADARFVPDWLASIRKALQ